VSAPIKFGSGSATVTMSPQLNDMVRRLTAGSDRAVLAEMAESADKIYALAIGRWPVSKRQKKMHSRDTIAAGTGSTSAGVSSFVVVPVAYAFYIKTKQNGLGGKSPWQELIRKPGIKEGKALAARCAVELALLAGGRRG
jgi:hypothetical protein